MRPSYFFYPNIFSELGPFSIKKYSTQVEYENAHRKEHVKKNQEKRGTNLNIPFFDINFSREPTQWNSKNLKETQGNSRELKGTQGNSSELKGIQWNSRKLRETQVNSSELI